MVLAALDANRTLNNGEPASLSRWLDSLDLGPGDRFLPSLEGRRASSRDTDLAHGFDGPAGHASMVMPRGSLGPCGNSASLRGVGQPVEEGRRHLRAPGVVDAGEEDSRHVTLVGVTTTTSETIPHLLTRLR